MASQPRQQVPPRAKVERFAENMTKKLRLLDDVLPTRRSRAALHEASARGILECAVCLADEELFLCSECKTVMYCSKECQLKAWKEGHEVRCCKTAY